MNEKTKSSKNKNKRLAKTETLEAETERSIAVAKMKQAHKLIEDAEKLRKRSAILSICRRIDSAIQSAQALAVELIKSKITFELTGTATGNLLRHVAETYESIRFDLMKTMSIKDEDFEKLFPKVEVNLGTVRLAGTSLLNISDQYLDIKIYCERLLR